MPYTQKPQLGQGWERGSRFSILKWLTGLRKSCIRTVDFTTLPQDFLSVGWSEGIPETCDFIVTLLTDGTVYMSVDNARTWILVYDASTTGTIPTGSSMWWGGNFASIPTGWLACDGLAVSRVTYLDLFNVIGTTYGVGDGSTTFNLPDYRGRVGMGSNHVSLPNGSDGTLTTRNEGVSSGVETHVLVESEMAAHSHASKRQIKDMQSGGTTKAATNTVNTGFTGSDTSHSNMSPFLTLYAIIKT